jgi:hypothetical protein
VKTPKEKRPLQRHRRRWKVNNKNRFERNRIAFVDWNRLIQGRDQWIALLNTAIKFRVP